MTKAIFKKPLCPYCGKEHNNVRCDTQEQITSCTCIRCNKKYKIIHGNGCVRTEK